MLIAHTSPAKIKPLNDEARAALTELCAIMKGLQYVRNSVAHGIMLEDEENGYVIHLRSKRRTLTKEQVFSTEELTNYAAHVVYGLRYALGLKEAPESRREIPARPEIPDFLRQLIPAQKH